MCNVEGCGNKPWKNGFCYTKHRKLANAPVVKEIVAHDVNKIKNEELFVGDIIAIEDKPMSPHSLIENASDQSPIDTIAKINNDKINYFSTHNFILGNVSITFSDDGKKKATNWCKWKDLVKSESIIGKNFLIRTGIKSFITVFDVDVKPDCNGIQNLIEFGIDFDDYLDDCIKVKTQSGGYHYIFQYDQRFKTGANCYGILGFDIRNDDAVIFAGERYNIVSIGKKFNCPSSLDEIYDIFNSNDTSDEPVVVSAAPRSNGGKSDSKYFELLNLLEDKYFNQFDLWVKPIYAMRNEIENGVDETIAYDTCDALLQARSNSYDKTEFDRIWKLKMKDTNKRFKIGSIVNILKEHAPDAYAEWNSKWFPKKAKGKSDKQLAKDAEMERAQLRDEMLEEFVDKCKELDRTIIREDNGIELNDMLMDDSIYTVEEIAKLIKQTCIKVENNGDGLYFVKTNFERKFKRTSVDTVKYEPRTNTNLASEVSIEYKDEVFTEKLLNLIIAARTTLNYKKVVLEPYGALDEDNSVKRKNFNLFSGWVHKFDPNFVVDQTIVDVWLDHLRLVVSNNDEAVFNHLMYYFKHILINPMDKTGLVIIVNGEQGSGKNSTFDIFYRFVLGPHVSLTTSRMDMITGRFNALRESMICCCLDEAVDNGDRSAMNQFKNLITSDEVQIERKGVDPITLSDYSNYVVISNNDFASLIEETDRRALCLKTNNSKRNDRSYFRNYYDKLGSLNAGKHLFHYLINSVNIPENWHPQDIPKTEYKQDLKKQQASTPVKYLLHLYESCEDDVSVKEEPCSFVWSNYVQHCQFNRLNAVSSAAFYKIIAKFIPTKLIDGIKSKVYSRSILEEALANYL